MQFNNKRIIFCAYEILLTIGHPSINLKSLLVRFEVDTDQCKWMAPSTFIMCAIFLRTQLTHTDTRVNGWPACLTRTFYPAQIDNGYNVNTTCVATKLVNYIFFFYLLLLFPGGGAGLCHNESVITGDITALKKC